MVCVEEKREKKKVVRRTMIERAAFEERLCRIAENVCELCP